MTHQAAKDRSTGLDESDRRSYPFRQVVHIDTITGASGGLSWKLKLECGHTEFRRQKAFDPVRWWWRKIEVHLAPERVRCVTCGVARGKK